jgi:hypothetical protein
MTIKEKDFDFENEDGAPEYIEIDGHYLEVWWWWYKSFEYDKPYFEITAAYVFRKGRRRNITSYLSSAHEKELMGIILERENEKCLAV